MEIVQLTEGSVYDFIKEGKVVVKVWSDKCPHCENIKKPFLEAVAQLPEYKFGEFRADYFDKTAIPFRDKYVKAETAPVILVFENGELRNAFYGVMNSERLIVEFIKEGKRDNTIKYLEEYEKNKSAALNKNKKPITIEEYCAKASVTELKASIYDEIVNRELAENNIKIFQQALLAKQQPQKATA